MFKRLNVKLFLYVVLSLIIVLGGAYKVNEVYEMLGAVVYLVGSLYVCIIYGMRWFGSTSALGSTPDTWPPVINTCPDYLTYFARIKADGTVQNTCIDTMGIAKGGILQIFPKDGVTNTPAGDNYYFDLTTTTANKNMELCKRAMDFGLTWEGITNGEACISSNGTATGSGGSGTCNQAAGPIAPVSGK
jgi:hypothetical protein